MSAKTWQTILSIKIKQRDLLSDRKNVYGLIAYLGLLRTTGVDSSIQYGWIERSYESLKTYDTNTLYI